MENPIRRSLRHKGLMIMCFLFPSLFFTSCDKKEIFYHFYEIKNGEWAQTDTLVFDIDSTLFELNVPYALDIEVTNNVSYPYQNIWFFMYTDSQNDSSTVKVEKEFILADKFGKWLGSGFGHLYQISFNVDNRLIFTEKRNYQIKLIHGMRDEKLDGIEKVGIKIQKQE